MLPKINKSHEKRGRKKAKVKSRKEKRERKRLTKLRPSDKLKKKKRNQKTKCKNLCAHEQLSTELKETEVPSDGIEISKLINEDARTKYR